MLRHRFTCAVLALVCQSTYAQTMILSTSSNDYEVFESFNDVRDFAIEIEIDAPLAAGVYNNPPIINITYEVSGTLTEPTPSEFSAFALERSISGEEFYAQGSFLNFEISEAADLSDGVQADELESPGVILSLNARETNTGRFHPPLFVLNADGSGQIQNSNNTPSESPLVQVGLGEEYITNLEFDLGNLTLITENGGGDTGGDSGGGSASWYFLMLGLLLPFRKMKYRKNS